MATKKNKFHEMRALPVELTPEEMLREGQNLASAQEALSKAEADKKAAAKQAAASVDTAKANVSLLTSVVASGKVTKDVSCLWSMNQPKPGRKVLVRQDTKEVVETRDMTPDDQDELPIVGEQAEAETERLKREAKAAKDAAGAGDSGVREIQATVIPRAPGLPAPGDSPHTGVNEHKPSTGKGKAKKKSSATTWKKERAAHTKGKLIERRYVGEGEERGPWEDCPNPQWTEGAEYRVKEAPPAAPKEPKPKKEKKPKAPKNPPAPNPPETPHAGE